MTIQCNFDDRVESCTWTHNEPMNENNQARWDSIGFSIGLLCHGRRHIDENSFDSVSFRLTASTYLARGTSNCQASLAMMIQGSSSSNPGLCAASLFRTLR